MAEIKQADGIGDWLEQRLAVSKLVKVLATEYWIPKNINFLWAMGMILAIMFMVLLVSADPIPNSTVKPLRANGTAAQAAGE